MKILLIKKFKKIDENIEKVTMNEEFIEQIEKLQETERRGDGCLLIIIGGLVLVIFMGKCSPWLFQS